MKIKLTNESIKLKAIPHPGKSWASDEDDDFTASEKVKHFGHGKVAIVGKEGAFFGHIAQYTDFKHSHSFSCLTVFDSTQDAHVFIANLNNKIEKQIISCQLRLI